MNDGVWYALKVITPGNITVTIINVDNRDPELAVNFGAFGQASTCVSSVDVGATGGNETLTLTSLPVGTYNVNVGHFSSNTDNPEGSFTITISNTAILPITSFNSEGFTYYSNPVQYILNLSYTKNISSVSVHNLLRQGVLAKTINASQEKIDLSNLSNGTYLVKVNVDGLIKL